jgi:hypothetical protein
MKGQVVVSALFSVAVLAGVLRASVVEAASYESCDGYRQEIVQLKHLLDAKYGEDRVLLRDMKSDPAAREALLAQYIVDPDNIRFSSLMDKFRVDRPDECGWWKEPILSKP